MIINETKGYATNRLEQQNQGLKETCSDHNVIFLISIQKPFKQKNGKQLTTTEQKKYRENIEQLEISKIIATGQIQNTYDKWCEVVQ